MHIVEETVTKQPAPFALPGVGVRLREIRKQIGVSTTVIGKKAGINPNSITQWEREVVGRTPTLEKIKGIVDVYVQMGAYHPFHQSKQRGHILEYIIWGE